MLSFLSFMCRLRKTPPWPTPLTPALLIGVKLGVMMPQGGVRLKRAETAKKISQVGKVSKRKRMSDEVDRRKKGREGHRLYVEDDGIENTRGREKAASS